MNIMDTPVKEVEREDGMTTNGITLCRQQKSNEVTLNVHVVEPQANKNHSDAGMCNFIF